MDCFTYLEDHQEALIQGGQSQRPRFILINHGTITNGSERLNGLLQKFDRKLFSRLLRHLFFC